MEYAPVAIETDGIVWTLMEISMDLDGTPWNIMEWHGICYVTIRM